MKKYFQIVILFTLLFKAINLSAEEKINIEKRESSIFNEAKLKKLELSNASLWALLKNVQLVQAASNLSVREIEKIFNAENKFLPIQESTNEDLKTISLNGYYAKYKNIFNSAEYYLVLKNQNNNNYPVLNDDSLQIQIILPPNLNQCITRHGIQVFNKELNIIYSFPPQFKLIGNSEEEKIISREKFITQNKKYYPKYYMNYHASNALGIGFSFAENDCLLTATVSRSKL